MTFHGKEGPKVKEIMISSRDTVCPAIHAIAKVTIKYIKITVKY